MTHIKDYDPNYGNDADRQHAEMQAKNDAWLLTTAGQRYTAYCDAVDEAERNPSGQLALLAQMDANRRNGGRG